MTGRVGVEHEHPVARHPHRPFEGEDREHGKEAGRQPEQPGQQAEAEGVGHPGCQEGDGEQGNGGDRHRDREDAGPAVVQLDT